MKYRIANEVTNPDFPILQVLDTETDTLMSEPKPGEEVHFLWRQYQDWRAAGNTPDPLAPPA